MNIGSYVLIAIVVLAIVFAKKAIVIISQSETRIIERLGRYFATLSIERKKWWQCATDAMSTQTL